MSQGGLVINEGENKKTFSGVALYRPIFFEEIPKNEFIRLSTVLKNKADKKLIKGKIFNGLWIDIGTPERLNSQVSL